MTAQSDIIETMQFSFLVGKTINSTGLAREVITFQYAGTTPPSAGEPDNYTGGIRTGWTDFTTAEKAKFDEALAHIETFLNVDFVEVTGDADPDLNVGNVDFDDFAGLGGLGISSSFSGDITRVDSFVLYDNTLALEDHIDLLLHELGHSLGLKHPFSSPVVPTGTDSNKYSIMSYTENPDNGLDADTMQLYDLLALQDLWGEAAYNEGDTTYTGKRNSTVDAVWDTGGTDHFDASASATAVTLDLRQGKFSTFGTYEDVVVAYNTKIENATGGDGTDSIFGNGMVNVLKGGKGRDVIKGNGGGDEMRGGNSNDKLYGGKGADDLFGGSGRDKLRGDIGRDNLTGGSGADKFIFNGDFGKDTIKDFEDDIDTLQINRSDVSSVEDALSFAKESKGNVVFTFDDGSKITVKDMTITDLTDDISIA